VLGQIFGPTVGVFSKP
jgi:hypothetical protein